MTTSAHTLTQTKLCTKPGCPNEAGWTHGKYAGLCKQHAEAKRRESPTASAPAAAANRDGFEAKIKTLAKLGREVDKAAGKIAEAERKLAAARREARDREREFRQLAAELIGNEATAIAPPRGDRDAG